MRLKYILSLVAIILLVISCFLPWLSFQNKSVVFSGVDEMKLILNSNKEINWGRPGYFNLFWAAIFLLFLFIKKSWTMWMMLVAAGFNIAWTIRNFVLLPACGGSECPERKEGLYLLLIASLLMFFAAFLSGEKPVKKNL
jgi:hypothetical protein